jgi:hypothetical protein
MTMTRAATRGILSTAIDVKKNSNEGPTIPAIPVLELLVIEEPTMAFGRVFLITPVVVARTGTWCLKLEGELRHFMIASSQCRSS